MVDRLQREVERHELDDRLQPAHRRAGAEPGEAVFGNRRVDDACWAEFLEQPLRDLVRPLILGDLLAHDEDGGVDAHLLGHRVAQRFADGLAVGRAGGGGGDLQRRGGFAGLGGGSGGGSGCGGRVGGAFCSDGDRRCT